MADLGAPDPSSRDGQHSHQQTTKEATIEVDELGTQRCTLKVDLCGKPALKIRGYPRWLVTLRPRLINTNEDGVTPIWMVLMDLLVFSYVWQLSGCVFSIQKP